MNQRPYLSIPIQDQIDKFSKHLKLENNERIIFSGRFGSGKTTFLKEYFTQNKDYVTLFLSPVNYSISSNKDIFELIKFDLLWELVKIKEVEYETLNFSQVQTFQAFLTSGDSTLNETAIKGIQHIIEMVPLAGKSISEGIGFVKKLYEAYQSYHKKINIHDNNKINSYLDSFKKDKLNLYEKDLYSDLIVQSIRKLRQIDKKIVLIIDDLDRLDPEHIFRILNIFSAKIDISPFQKEDTSYPNKFELDNIIIVCDIDNIRKIYASKYGQSAHFSGYIDKFYSKTIYNFNISKFAYDKTKQVLSSVDVINAPYIPYLSGKVVPLQAILAEQYDSFILLIGLNVESSFISIRELLKIEGSEFILVKEFNSDNDVRRIEQFSLLYFNFLKMIFNNDIEEIKSIIYNSQYQNYEIEDISKKNLNSYLLGNLIYLRNKKSDYYRDSDLIIVKDKLEFNDIKYEVNLKFVPDQNAGFNKHNCIASISKILEGVELLNPELSALESRIHLGTLNPFEILNLCYEEYKKMGFL